MRNRCGSILMFCGLLLVAAALVLTGYNFWDNYRAEVAVNNVLSEIEQLRKSDDNKDAQGEIIPDYLLNPEMDMPAVEIDGYRYIGTVTIPAFELELPVMESWSYPQMKIAPCRYTGSVYLNNMVIAAHNYTSHFGRLKNMQTGDDVIFTDMDGNIFRYKVAELKSLPGTAVEEMTSGDWDLTLFTCTISGQARFTVRCKAADNS